METATLRGHHLGSLCYAVQRTGNFGRYYEQLFGGKMIRITDSIDDEVCRECPAQQPYCGDRYQNMDRELAALFGLQVGQTYSFDQIKERLSQAHLDDYVMQVVLLAQKIR